MKNLKTFNEAHNKNIEGEETRYYDVTAQAFNRATGEQEGKSRTEKVDAKTNPIFKKCKTIMDIHDAYESFWNDMNPNSQEIVFVSKVTVGKSTGK